MKTILVPTEDNSGMQSALETALLVARRCDSYIEGFALRWSVAEFAGFEMMGGIPLETDNLYAARVEDQARQIFESFMQGHGVPLSAKATEALSFGWLNNAPQGETFVGSYGRVFDVIVMARPGANTTFVYNRVQHKVARFRQVNMDDPHLHHDALEFPGGQIVMVTRLTPGQRATVLQLPASVHTRVREEHAVEHFPQPIET